MRRSAVLTCALSYLALTLILSAHGQVSACSTFKLQKGDGLIYGHNLNYGDIGVPGMIFINKREIFKLGRTWSELTTKDRENPSSHCWVSRYGSVTFNAWGRDLPDGGMNETGLYIWEMNEDGEYPKNDSLPTIYELNWMQYVLDNYSTLDEALRCASEIQIEGPVKHYFVGDAVGNCAAVAFIGGKVVVNCNETMPVPGLFNTPYARELEVSKYYKGFGGLYETDLGDPRVPRFVKTGVMIREYDPSHDIVDYGFEMLDSLKVWDVPEWSIVFDVCKRDVHFKTRQNPEIKTLSMDEIDFSNDGPVLILNMDVESGGDVLEQFHPYSNERMREFLKELLVPILPEEVFTSGGLTLDEYLDRVSTHSDAATLPEKQFFRGVWKNQSAGDGMTITLKLDTRDDAVFGEISFSDAANEFLELDHIHLIGDDLKFTVETDGQRNKFLEARVDIRDDEMHMKIYGIEDYYGDEILFRVNQN